MRVKHADPSQRSGRRVILREAKHLHLVAAFPAVISVVEVLP